MTAEALTTALSAPNATYSDDLYRFHWPDYGIEALVERLIAEKTDIRCEVTIRSEHEGRLYSGHLLLMGPNSRRDVANQLRDRIKDFDWGGFLEQICLLSRDRFRQGEPVVELWSVPSSENARWLVEPFVLDRAITILYGDGAAAKSSLALNWGIATCLEFGPVLYLDWEDDAATHAERLRALCAGRRMDPAGAEIYYQRRATKLAESVRELRRIVVEKGIVLVIVDSLGMAAGDPNNSDFLIEAVRACRALNVAVLAIHHLPKTALDKSKPFGSVYASNEARLTWLVEKAQEEDSDEFTILLTNNKSNRSRLFGKRAMKVAFANSDAGELESIRFASADAAEVEAFRLKLPWWRHIAHILRKPMTYDEIAKALEADNRKTTVANVRARMGEHPKVFINVGSARAAVWALAEQDDEANARYRTVSHEGVRTPYVEAEP